MRARVCESSHHGSHSVLHEVTSNRKRGQLMITSAAGLDEYRNTRAVTLLTTASLVALATCFFAPIISIPVAVVSLAYLGGSGRRLRMTMRRKATLIAMLLMALAYPVLVFWVTLNDTAML